MQAGEQLIHSLPCCHSPFHRFGADQDMSLYLDLTALKTVNLTQQAVLWKLPSELEHCCCCLGPNVMKALALAGALSIQIKARHIETITQVLFCAMSCSRRPEEHALLPSNCGIHLCQRLHQIGQLFFVMSLYWDTIWRYHCTPSCEIGIYWKDGEHRWGFTLDHNEPT